MRAVLIAIAVIFTQATAALASGVLLSVTLANGESTSMSRADLEAMPVTEFTTSTLWTSGEVTFTGVSLVDFFAALGVETGVMRAVAINDYAVEIPVSDAAPGGPIVAYQMNGEAMSPRDKGPLWVVYPYDANVDYQAETYYSRSIWQLTRIEITD